MMCVCRRCQRLAAAMDDDVLGAVDDDVADLIDVAFSLAHVHAAADVGFEHVLHAMTSLGVGQEILSHAGVGAAVLREEAARVMASRGDAMGFAAVTPVLDDDVVAALELAGEDALERGAEFAALGDLLAVLMGYRPGEMRLAHLFVILHAGGGRVGAHEQANTSTIGAVTGSSGAWERAVPWSLADEALHELDASADPLDVPDDVSATLDQIEARLAGIDARAEEDRQRIVHVLHELSRQRERLPAADDWRSQMQDLAMQVDALRRRIDAWDTRSAGAGAAAARHSARDVVEMRASNRGGETDLQSAASTSGGMAAAVAASAAAMLVPTRAAPVERPTVDATQQRRTQSSPDIDARQSGLAQSQGVLRTARREGRSSAVRGRARRRTWHRFGRLELAQIARLGLRGRPKRRERSWWRWLKDRERWRAERHRGGRFRAFGERFNHRARASSQRGGSERCARGGGAEVRELEKRFHLAMADDIVDAPSIGPKTAERLRPARIFTVRDLLEADAEVVGSIVTARHITAQAVRDWQDQARLVITIPFLRGTHAQLLVGAGFRSYEDVALADSATLMSALLKFATTRVGQSILRNGPPPDVEKVIRWIENAVQSEPARAA